MASKIDSWGLGAKVLTLRKELTCEEVADIVNSQYLPAGEEPITKTTVSRYCSARGVTDMDRHDITKSVTTFDALAEAVKVRNRLERRTNKMEKLLNEIKEDEEKLSELSSVNNAYLNCCKLLQDLNESVSRIQKEQLGVDKVRMVLKTFISTLDKYPEVKADIFARLRESAVYDTIRSL